VTEAVGRDRMSTGTRGGREGEEERARRLANLFVEMSRCGD